jgi:hypothetical protein
MKLLLLIFVLSHPYYGHKLVQHAERQNWRQTWQAEQTPWFI